jgi:hypothetical protein
MYGNEVQRRNQDDKVRQRSRRGEVAVFPIGSGISRKNILQLIFEVKGYFPSD